MARSQPDERFTDAGWSLVRHRHARRLSGRARRPPDGEAPRSIRRGSKRWRPLGRAGGAKSYAVS